MDSNARCPKCKVVALNHITSKHCQSPGCKWVRCVCKAVIEVATGRWFDQVAPVTSR